MKNRVLILLLFLGTFCFARFSAVSIQTIDEYKAIPERIGSHHAGFPQPKESASSFSCLSHLVFDVCKSSVEIFGIKDALTNGIVGIAVLHIIPKTQLEKIGTFKIESGNRLAFCSLSQAIGISSSQAYAIKIGLSSCLAEYCELGLPAILIEELLIPKVQEIQERAPRNVPLYIFAGSAGMGSELLERELEAIWLNEGPAGLKMADDRLISLTQKADQIDYFTSLQYKLNLKKIPYYNFSLGSLYCIQAHF